MVKPLLTPIKVEWLEDSSAVILARIEDRPTAPNSRGTPLVQADLSLVTLWVHDITDPDSPAVVSGFNALDLTISSVIQDTLVGWSEDTIGANFIYTVGPTAFPTGGNRYRVTVRWTHADGRVGHTQWEGPAKSIDPS